MIRKINYNSDFSDIYHEIYEILPEFSDDYFEIKLDRKSHGLKAAHTVVIDRGEKFFFVDDFYKKNASLFSARIKALASVLRQRTLLGKFRITHEQGTLTCKRLEVGSIFSWRKFSETLIDKNLDKSSFIDSTAIPQELYFFFGIKRDNEKKEIRLALNKKIFLTVINKKQVEERTIQTLNLKPLATLLKENFPAWEHVQPDKSSPYYLEFSKTNINNKFKISLRSKEPFNSQELQENFDEMVADLLKKGEIKKPSGSKKPDVVQTSSKQYVRSPEVVAWILQNSEGRCEACGQDAPFKKKDGKLFLEVHHAKWLSEGGSDTVSNALAVCPNCHREFHYGKNKNALLENIYNNISRLVRE